MIGAAAATRADVRAASAAALQPDVVLAHRCACAGAEGLLPLADQVHAPVLLLARLGLTRTNGPAPTPTPHLAKAHALTVIHFCTAPVIHSCTAADQPVCRKHPQPYAQDASLAPSGAGVIGACSHAGPGVPCNGRPACRRCRLGCRPASPDRPRPSLIHPHPDPFYADRLEQAAEVANPVDLAWTQPRRLRKRVGTPFALGIKACTAHLWVL
jgi:hypothetical protein